MKLPCELIRDLLPLYEDRVCSEASQAFIEAHLAECPACRALLECSQALQPEEAPTPITEDRAVARSFRKVRRRWWVSLISALLILPMLLMSVNQYRGAGICFTNLDDIWAARRFCAALAEGDFDRAAGYMDCRSLYEDVQTALEWTPEDYMPQYRIVTIGTQEFALSPVLDDSGLDLAAEPPDVWSNIIFNGIWDCMIPEEVFAQVIALEPETVEHSDTGIYVNGRLFTRLETDWGAYYVCDEYGRALTADTLASAMLLLPAEIWNAALDELTLQAREQYEFNQCYYAAAKEMSYEEFEVYVRQAYADDLRQLAHRGYTFSLSGLEDCYYNGAWVVVYALNATDHSTSLRLSLHLSAGDNGLTLGAIGQSAAITDFEPADYLFFHYPS